MQRGSIVWIELEDPYGTDRKKRPALVLSSNDKILNGGDLVVAAISTAFTRPIPSHWFELPSHPAGHPRTGLDQPCVVKSDWLKTVSQSEILSELGMRAYRKVMRFIRAAVDERDFRTMRSLTFEKLKGNRSHQHSLRLNQQWRLIVELIEADPKNIVAVVAIEDYH